MDDDRIELEGGFTAEIHHDQDCDRPYADDDAVKIVILSRRYRDPAEGECGTTPDEVSAWAKKNARDWYVVPLWSYDHSGVAYAVGARNPFSCPWDSGRAGILALKKDEWGKGRGERNAKRLEYAQAVAREFSQWANGECYGYVLKDADGVKVDSCWGFIGRDTVEEAAREAAEAHRKNDGPQEGDRPAAGMAP